MRLRPPIKVHGGKFYLAAKMIPLLPAHTNYASLYGGGGSDLLQRKPSGKEWYNELDTAKQNVMLVLQNAPDQLRTKLLPVQGRKDDFLAAKARVDALPENHQWTGVDDAADYLIVNKLSRGGMCQAYADSTRLRGKQHETLNTWATFKALIPKYAERLADVRITNYPALDVLEELKYDETWLAYMDPPYLHTTRTAKRAYGRFEMSYAEHMQLVRHAVECRCAVAISGYHSELYDQGLEDFEVHEFSMPNNSGQGKTKQRRTEVLWCRQNRTARRMQGTLVA